ncbi:DUF3800 domain-containing protein [Corynebacterium lizhenjunii]|uniref:DUF3800 domain-containing protein n=1 Tax=Corynebacterium lizhenjunii TaxID=2709394 RepID=A0A7T0KDB5_9CORY|nr:DUF3800 domain-containing protein [Corynebacterium lizhenjunii]QPK78681.1 DUF3800 domain-containing protein [Corynebacterium lizhenjunii]
MYIGYFDEFGHNGAYISRADRRFKTHPVFGIGGFIIPADNIRQLSGAFRRIKEQGLKEEIEAKVISKGEPVEHWEKKGAALLTTQNVKKYREVRNMINRVLNILERLNAQVIFYGQEKPRGTNDETGEDERSRYDHAMNELIKRVNWSLPDDQHHLMILDKQGPTERLEVFVSSAKFMFSHQDADKLLEPPLEVESHLYQTVQCADWVCALIGRISSYKYDPEFKEFEWAIKYFGDRLARASSPCRFRVFGRGSLHRW